MAVVQNQSCQEGIKEMTYWREEGHWDDAIIFHSIQATVINCFQKYKLNTLLVVATQGSYASGKQENGQK